MRNATLFVRAFWLNENSNCCSKQHHDIMVMSQWRHNNFFSLFQYILSCLMSILHFHRTLGIEIMSHSIFSVPVGWGRPSPNLIFASTGQHHFRQPQEGTSHVIETRDVQYRLFRLTIRWVETLLTPVVGTALKFWFWLRVIPGEGWEPKELGLTQTTRWVSLIYSTRVQT